MSNLDGLADAYETAMNAEGSAMREQENYARSVQYSIDRFKAATQELSTDFLNAETLKAFVEGGTSVIEFLDYFIEKLTAIPALVGAAFGFAQYKGFGKFMPMSPEESIFYTSQYGNTRKAAWANALGMNSKSQITAFKDAGLSQYFNKSQIDGAADYLSKFSDFDNALESAKRKGKDFVPVLEDIKKQAGGSSIVIADTTANLNKLSKSGATAASGMAKLGAGFKAFAASAALNLGVMGAVALISLLVQGIAKLHKSKDEIAELADTAATSMRDFHKSMGENAKTVSDLNDEYQELAKGVSASGQNISLSSDQYDRYKEIVGELSGIMPELVTTFNSQGEAIGFVTGKLQDANAEYEKYIQNSAQERLFGKNEDGSPKDILTDYYLKANKNTGDNYNTKITATENLLKYTGDKDALQRVVDQYAFVKKELGVTAGDIAKMSKDEYGVFVNNLNTYLQNLKQAKDVEFDNIRTLLKDYALANDNYWQKLTDDEKQYVDTFIQALPANLFDQLDIDTTNPLQVQTWFNDIINQIDTNKGEISDAINGLFEIDALSLNPDEYIAEVDAFIDTILMALGLEKTEENRAQLRIALVPDYSKIQSSENGMYRLGQDVRGDTSAGAGFATAWNSFTSDISTDDTQLILNNQELFRKNAQKIFRELDGGTPTLLTFKRILQESKSELREAANEAENYSDKVSKINSATDSLEKLQKVYDDIADGGDFDFGSLDELSDFKGYEGYEELIKVISKFPNDTKKVQKAFDNLATEWVYGSNVLDDLSDETKEYTIAVLKQKGIINAEAIVAERLAELHILDANTTKLSAQAKYELMNASAVLTDASMEEINALLQEESTSDETKMALFRLLAAKGALNRVTINTSADIKNLMALAAQAGLTKGELISLQNVMAGVNSNATFWSNNSGKTTGKQVSANSKYKYPTPAKIGGSAGNASGGGGGGGGGGAEGSEPTPEDFDWIERKIKALEREIANLDKVANGTWRTWKERTEALNKEIEKTGDLIIVQQQAYEQYMAKANSYGLSADYMDKIINGTMQIETILDDELKQRIKDTQTWIDKAHEAEDAIYDLRDSLAKLKRQRFDNILKQFNDLIDETDFSIRVIESHMEQVEAEGYIAGRKYYEALIQAGYDKLSKLADQQYNSAGLLLQFEKGTEEYNSMLARLREIQDEGRKVTVQMTEWRNAIVELDWKIFDLVIEKMGSISEEAQFLIDLMDNKKLYEDNGQLTSQGMATMGMHAMNYDVEMELAERYKKELKNINNMLAKDPDNQTLYERRKELLELQRESILAAEEEKNAIRDMVEEGINIELDALSKLIDDYNELLDSERDLYQHGKDVSKQAKELAKLRKQMMAYAGDTSEENKARLQRLKVELENAEDQLEETEAEWQVNQIKKILDELYTEYEEILNTRLDDIELLLKDMMSLVNENISDISDTIQKAGSDVGYEVSKDMRDIWSESKSVVSTYLNKIVALLQGMSTTPSIDKYFDKVSAENTRDKLTDDGGVYRTYNLQTGKHNYTSDENEYRQWVTEGELEEGRAFISADKTDKSAIPIQRMYNKAADKYFYTPKDGAEYKKVLAEGGWIDQGTEFYAYSKAVNGAVPVYRAFRESTFDHLFTLNKDEWERAVKQDGYVKEGIPFYMLVKRNYATGARKIPKTDWAWTQEEGQEAIIRPSDGAILTPLAKNDSVLTHSATNALFDFANDPQGFVDKLRMSDVVFPIANQSSTGDINANIDMDITLPNVTNYAEFINELQRDPKFEKLVRSMTTDRIFGKSQLRKYSI